MQEFDFIRNIKKLFPNPWERSIGNDCALFKPNQKTYLITKDILVQGVHFFPDIPIKALAYKSLLVNMSDIFSDGGTPLFFIIGIGANESLMDKMDEMYYHMNQYCRKWDVTIMGGDTVKSDTLIVSVTCVGSIDYEPWLRKNAKQGDFIYVTGELGASSFGLEKIKKRGHDPVDLDISRHLFPPYRKKVVSYLRDRVNAAIDISDGFLQDLARILEESQKGACLYEDQIPFSKSILPDKKDCAFYGGEDYELILITSEKINHDDFFNNTGVNLTRVGEILSDPDKFYLKRNGKNVLLKKECMKGYRHW